MKACQYRKINPLKKAKNKTIARFDWACLILFSRNASFFVSTKYNPTWHRNMALYFVFLKVILMTVSIEQSNNYIENSPENYPNLWTIHSYTYNWTAFLLLLFHFIASLHEFLQRMDQISFVLNCSSSHHLLFITAFHNWNEIESQTK